MLDGDLAVFAFKIQVSIISWQHPNAPPRDGTHVPPDPTGGPLEPWRRILRSSGCRPLGMLRLMVAPLASQPLVLPEVPWHQNRAGRCRSDMEEPGGCVPTINFIGKGSFWTADMWKGRRNASSGSIATKIMKKLVATKKGKLLPLQWQCR